ncbi:unnamed protein product [Moneuplotes crassus]|uniref:Uncharacterized protein n=1 Tax=Euplotes crassus TaxID=5936 RepID=A0AAD2D7Y3_EUPCR|nr:unnamed protein product [Moneuplotes crassus]
MIQGMPRCKTYMDCEKIAYMVRKSADNALKQDLFVCSMCMMTHYSDQVLEPIPEIDPITECLNSGMRTQMLYRWHSLPRMHIHERVLYLQCCYRTKSWPLQEELLRPPINYTSDHYIVGTHSELLKEAWLRPCASLF